MKITRLWVNKFYDGPLELICETSDPEMRLAAFRASDCAGFNYYLALPLSNRAYLECVEMMRRPRFRCDTVGNDRATEVLEGEAMVGEDWFVAREIILDDRIEGPYPIPRSLTGASRQLARMRPLASESMVKEVWQAARRAPYCTCFQRKPRARRRMFFALEKELAPYVAHLVDMWPSGVFGSPRNAQDTVIRIPKGGVDVGIWSYVYFVVDTGWPSVDDGSAALGLDHLVGMGEPLSHAGLSMTNCIASHPNIVSLQLPVVSTTDDVNVLDACEVSVGIYYDKAIRACRVKRETRRAFLEVSRRVELPNLAGPTYADGWPFPLRGIRYSNGAREWVSAGNRLRASGHRIGISELSGNQENE